MKKIFLWLLPIAALVLFANCTKDDETNKNTSDTTDNGSSNGGNNDTTGTITLGKLTKIYMTSNNKRWSSEGDTVVSLYPKMPYITLTWNGNLLEKYLLEEYNDGNVVYSNDATLHYASNTMTSIDFDITDFFYGDYSTTYEVNYANGTLSSLSQKINNAEYSNTTFTYENGVLTMSATTFTDGGYTRSRYTWVDGNVVQMEVEQSISGKQYTQSTVYTYDSQTNPTYGMVPGLGLMGFTASLSKNNRLTEHTVVNMNGAFFSDDAVAYSYTYQNGIPVSQTILSRQMYADEGGSYSETTFEYEYASK